MWLSLRRMVSITVTTIINPIFMSIIIINKKIIFQSDLSVEQRAQKVHQGIVIWCSKFSHVRDN
jgi:hypothetical protein